MKIEISWKSDVETEIESLKKELSNRPSATMDPCFEERVSMITRLNYLKSLRRKKERLPTRMMEAQQMRDYEEDFESVEDFSRKLIDRQEDLDPELRDIMDINLSDLYEED